MGHDLGTEAWAGGGGKQVAEGLSVTINRGNRGGWLR